MKGQASVEYLILGLVALSMLALSLTALSTIRDSALGGMAEMEARESASMLARSVRAVCALGSGNGREISIRGPGAGIESEKADLWWAVRISPIGLENAGIVLQSPCQVEGSENVSGTVYVKNEGGKIRITRR